MFKRGFWQQLLNIFQFALHCEQLEMEIGDEMDAKFSWVKNSDLIQRLLRNKWRPALTKSTPKIVQRKKEKNNQRFQQTLESRRDLWLSIIAASLVCQIICTRAADLILISAVLESQRTGKIEFCCHPVSTETASDLRQRMGWVSESKHTSTRTAHTRVTCQLKRWLVLSHGLLHCWVRSLRFLKSHSVFTSQQKPSEKLHFKPYKC